MATAAGAGAGGGNNIKVIARFRPQNKIELANGGQPVVEFDDEQTCRITAGTSPPFTLDRVFNMDSQQSDIFDYSIAETVNDVMNGYNGTVFAYGQTGAGKSYTMMGDLGDPYKKGIIPRMVEQIFYSIYKLGSANVLYTVGISYMEIYMEKIKDLLNPANDKMPIHENMQKGFYVKGLREVFVSSAEEVLEAMLMGQAHRAVASTNMNQESSRSHSIFCMNVHQRDATTDNQKSGRLYLVDLAGSEKVGKTGATGQTLEEAKKINLSLNALGNVINALSEGKSHVSYRDSVLTKILKDSLGGNSKTSLIINCSPSSYNAEETISTLRFGMRAKTVKNNAKVNAELSPAELKKQLKAADKQLMTFQNYIALADAELAQWRRGETVPEEKWTQSLTIEGGVARLDTKSRPESRLLPERVRAETPSRPDSRTGDRASTPSIPMEKDEREEYMRRENELQDQLAEKETQAANAERALQELQDEMRLYRDTQSRMSKDHENVQDSLNRAQMELQKLSFERNDEKIEMERLRNDNDELGNQVHALQQEVLSIKMSAKETSAVLEDKDKKKQERMAKMLAGFDLGNDAFSENERRMQAMLEQIDLLEASQRNGQAVPTSVLASLRTKITEAQAHAIRAESSFNDRGEYSLEQDSKRIEAEERLLSLERKYEDLLTKNLSHNDLEEIKQQLAEINTDRGDTQTALINDLRDEMSLKEQEIARLQKSLVDLQANPAVNGTATGAAHSPASRTLQQQMADFDMMKKNLMRDLQNRCERVVELEISLDETREQYNNVLRSSNNKQQQKKMAFLERNLEQLTAVQRQLVDQNTSLKKEVAIAERKLLARNDRIMSLEQLLSESQEKLTQANHRFEAQLQAVKERLESAKASQANRGMAPPNINGAGYSGLSFAGRIAKPLRGGGGLNHSDAVVNGGGPGPSIPYLSSLASGGEGTSPNNKRTSWFFNKS